VNPRDRKLRLRKDTLCRLDPEDASNVLGGALTVSVFIECDLEPKKSDVCPPETRAFTNCIWCHSTPGDLTCPTN